MIKLTTSNTLITAIWGLICLVIIIFVIMPSLNDILRLSNQIESQRLALEEMYQCGQSLKKTHQQFEEVKSEITEIQDILLQEGKELNFITSLENTANKNNVTQDIQLDTQNINHMSGYYIMPIQLTLSGGYENILRYIVDIEKQKYYLNFTQLVLSNQGAKMFTSKIKISESPLAALQKINSKDSHTIHVTINALSYWRSSQ